MKDNGDLGLTYAEAMHGIQTGVKYEIENDARGRAGGATQKDLRVGINSALLNDAAIAMLLIEKGIITLDEYTEAVRLSANRELFRYEMNNPGVKFR